MGMGRILEQYRTQFPDDRATFSRWLKANAVIGSILGSRHDCYGCRWFAIATTT